MTDTKIALSSLALDLRRVAMGYHRGSTAMADRFLAEALRRKDEIKSSDVKPYVAKLLVKISSLKTIEDNSDKAEDALMYSILFQNAAISL